MVQIVFGELQCYLKIANIAWAHLCDRISAWSQNIVHCTLCPISNMFYHFITGEQYSACCNGQSSTLVFVFTFWHILLLSFHTWWTLQWQQCTWAGTGDQFDHCANAVAFDGAVPNCTPTAEHFPAMQCILLQSAMLRRISLYIYYIVLQCTMSIFLYSVHVYIAFYCNGHWA